MFEVTLETEKLHDLAVLLGRTVNNSLADFYPPGAEEVPDELNDGGIWIEDSGEDNTVYTDMRQPAHFFETFEMSQPTSVGMRWSGDPGVQDIANVSDAKYMTMKMDEDDHYLHFHDSNGMHFKMAPIDKDSLEPTKAPTARWPDYEYAFSFATTMQEFMNALDSVDLITSDGKLVARDEWDDEFTEEDGDDPFAKIFLQARGDIHELENSIPLGSIEDEDTTLVESAFETNVLKSFIDPINSNGMAGRLQVSMLEYLVRASDGTKLDGRETWIPTTFNTTLYGDIETSFVVAPLVKEDG